MMEVDLPVPEGAQPLVRVEKGIGEVGFPAAWKPTGTEGHHKVVEGERLMSVSVAAKPGTDAGILETK